MERDGATRFSRCVFAASIIFCIWALSVGWSNPLTDLHSFRQTQTAISVLFMSRGGPLVDYETPVLGAPWSCPFEFPLFHWIVLSIHHFGLPLDQSGRTVSIMFLFAAYAAVYRLLRRLGYSSAERLLAISIFFVSPHFLFWGRAFLIETTALALSLWYLVLAAELGVFVLSGRVISMSKFICAFALGVLAALVKITTFVIFPFLVVCLALALSHRKRFLARVLASLPGAAALLIAPVILSQHWVAHADQLREQVPFAQFLVSSDLVGWFFGSFAQRLEWASWHELIFNQAFADVAGHPFAVLFFGLLALVQGAARRWTLFWLAAFFVFPAVFFNLFVVHDYYQTANGFFLLLALTTVAVGLARSGYHLLSRIFILSLLVLSIQGYLRRFYPFAAHPDRTVIAVADSIRIRTNSEDVILIYGQDWNPQLPYYAQRRAIMDREFRAPEDSALRRTLMLSLDRRRLGAIVACGDTASLGAELERRVEALGFNAAEFDDIAGCRIFSTPFEMVA